MTQVQARQIRRWADVGIVPIAGGGSQGVRREYSLRNLAEIVVCERLQRLGVAERGLKAAVSSIEYTLTAWSFETTRKLAKTVLWISLSPHAVRRYDASIEAAGTFTRGAPIIRMVSSLEVHIDLMTSSGFGIAINIADIVADLEKKTGETLS